MAVHTSNLTNGDFHPVLVRFNRVTMAMAVVTGVKKRNQSVKSSARFSGNQCEMRRSMGNANRKVKKPAKQGKHHQSGTQTFFRYWTVCSELVTLGPQPDILTASAQRLCPASRVSETDPLRGTALTCEYLERVLNFLDTQSWEAN